MKVATDRSQFWPTHITITRYFYTAISQQPMGGLCEI